MGWLLAPKARRILLGALATLSVLAGLTSSGGAANGQAAGLPNLAGVWDVTFSMPPCAIGCGSRTPGGVVVAADNYTFTQVAANTYDIANDEGFHALGVVVSGGASTASATVCWAAPPTQNSNCPGGRAPGAGYGIQTMSFVFPSNGQWR
jgi:hypothetical protein